MDAAALRERRAQWLRFHEWEQSAPEAQSPWDLRQRLDWFRAAWDLAARLDPEWGAPRLRPEKLAHLRRVQERLSLVRVPHEHH